jgi:hypothetical protein
MQRRSLVLAHAADKEATMRINGCKMWRVFAALVLGFGFVAGSFAQAPTDTDLRASYCVGVVTQHKDDLRAIFPGIDVSGSEVPEVASRDWAKTNERGRHLAQYLAGRFDYVDPVGLLMAKTRGINDVRLLQTPPMLACSEKCTADQNSDVAHIKACMLACNPESMPRIWSCNDLSWLPF